MLQYYTCMQYTEKYPENIQYPTAISRELLGLFICVCSSLCTIVAHNTAQNRPDNFPSCPPDNHHCSDNIYFREAGVVLQDIWSWQTGVFVEQGQGNVAHLRAKLHNATQSGPGDVGVERRHLRVELLVSADERVLVDLPDLAVVVPRRQVVAEVLPVGRHAGRDLPLDLLDLRVLGNHLVDRLPSQPRHGIHRSNHKSSHSTSRRPL